MHLAPYDLIDLSMHSPEVYQLIIQERVHLYVCVLKLIIVRTYPPCSPARNLRTTSVEVVLVSAYLSRVCGKVLQLYYLLKWVNLSRSNVA
jgi:hypothetical protein